MRNYNKLLNKSSITCFLIIIISFNSYSQSGNHKKSSFWENVSFGGGLGLSFGDGFFSGTIAPSAIYNFNSSYSLGIGLNGSYIKDDFYKATIVGGSIINLYNPFPELQLSAEFEELNVSRTFETASDDIDDNYWVPALFVGAGYRSGNVTFGLRYDILYDSDKSIYANAYVPFVRFYF
ncbi:alpha-ketoglutarate decarboxylase [Abyssalbus ytuae]|uniref:Alpha-ketoglutarate decarboxylase n=1 Tax=Abyssalbus ytuae TaxID=2926907 RepID=A0A9E7CUW3_9FLAO|nr:alpha-ketoglutarate decarboxylase [Abyssalbus ytuae]UOB19047.1 alpha-ketoglutarate decarboxylase [Abyssalbus ytuae]